MGRPEKTVERMERLAKASLGAFGRYWEELDWIDKGYLLDDLEEVIRQEAYVTMFEAAVILRDRIGGPDRLRSYVDVLRVGSR